MIKILHLGLSKNLGGVENLVMNYYRHIDKDKFQFDFVDMYGDGIGFKTEIHTLGGKIYRLPNYKKHPLKATRRMNDILKKRDYQIVHIHMQSAANLLPVFVGLHNKEVRIIAHSHSSSTPKGIMRKLLHVVNITILRNLNVEKWACGICAGRWMWADHFKSENIIVNAIEGEKFSKNIEIRKNIRNKCGFQTDDQVIGFVGRFGDEKNTLFLLKVLTELIKLSDKYKLLTVGTGKLYRDFKKEVYRSKLERKVYLAGTQTNVNIWYQAMDAFLLPSFFEGFPMVGLEAQVSGLPCFFSDRISSEIDVSKESNFISIDNGCEWEWASKIHKTLNMHKLRDYQIPEMYRINNAVKLLEKKYEILDTGDSHGANKGCKKCQKS